MTYFLFVGLLALLILITDFLFHIPDKVKRILSITGLVMIGVGTIGNMVLSLLWASCVMGRMAYDVWRGIIGRWCI